MGKKSEEGEYNIKKVLFLLRKFVCFHIKNKKVDLHGTSKLV